MKQYKVIKSSVDQLESKLNNFAKQGWTVIDLAVLAKENMVAVLEKSFWAEEELLQDIPQQQSQLFQTMSDIIKSQHDVSMSIIKNMKA
jgi:hypothetical protein